MSKEQKLKLGLHESLSAIKGAMSTMTFRPTGKAKNYTYFELKDFLPTATNLLAEYGIDDNFEIIGNIAMVTFKKGNEIKVTRIPYISTPTPTAWRKDKQGNRIPNSEYETMSPIQHYGSLITYHKRYTYQNAFNISEGDIVENHVRYERAIRDLQLTITNYDLDRNKVSKHFKVGANASSETLENVVEQIKKMNNQELGKLKDDGYEPQIQEQPKNVGRKAEPKKELIIEEPKDVSMGAVEEVQAELVQEELPFETDEPIEEPKKLTPKQKWFAELDRIVEEKGFVKKNLYAYYKVTDKTTIKELQAIIVDVKAKKGRK